MAQVYTPTEDEIVQRIWALRRREPGERGFPGNNCDEAGFRTAAIRELLNDELELQDIIRVERRGY